MASQKHILTTWEAGRYCAVSPYTVRYWVDRGMLPAYTTPGGHRRIRREDLDDFLARYRMPAEEELLTGPRRVLLLEADARTRRSHSALLTALSEDLDVRAPEDPFTAGTLVPAFRPQLVFFDLDDPRLDWRAAFQMLRRAWVSGKVRAAGLTRHLTVEREEEGEVAGLARVLLKPLEATAARELLREVFPYLRLAAAKPSRPKAKRAAPPRRGGAKKARVKQKGVRKRKKGA